MSIFSRNVEVGPAKKISSWRKVAIGTWKTAADPTVYANLDLNMGPALDYIEKLKNETGVKITMTHFLGKAAAENVRRNPDINMLYRFGRLYPRKNVDTFFQVATDPSGKDLSGLVIRRADQKSIVEIAQEMEDSIKSIRKKGDPGFRKTKSIMGKVPGFFAKSILDLMGFIMYSLNVWSPLLGSPKDPFGSMMITNIGTLGLESALVPLVPYCRMPMLLALGAVKEVPVVRDGKIVIGQVARLNVTFDHRIMDGVHGSILARTMHQIFDNPEKELGPVSSQTSNETNLKKMSASYSPTATA